MKLKKVLNKLNLGSIIYTIAFLKAIKHFETFDLEVDVAGQTTKYENVWIVTVSNQPFYGGGMKIAPTANPRDNLLNITMIKDISPFKLIFLFVSVFFGKHIHLNEVDTLEVESIVLKTSRKVLVHADGEDVGESPVSITIQHKKLNLIT
jgi:diacylglycerol kinase (ATP)